MRPTVQHVLAGALIAGLVGVAQAKEQTPANASRSTERRLGAAVDAAERTVRRNPEDAAARTVLGNAYLKMAVLSGLDPCEKCDSTKARLAAMREKRTGRDS